MSSSQTRRWLAVAALASMVVSPAWAEPGEDPPQNGAFRFAVIGDHRGDNKAYNETLDGYTDHGMNIPVLVDIATALRAEGVEFVLDVGDLVTKWKKQLKNIKADALLTRELKEWGEIWNANSNYLPIFPVRGNQEVTATPETWRNFTKTMPGIGDLPPNGPPGEEGMTYSFKYKNCLFVGVDQYFPPGDGDTHVISHAALEWMDHALSESGNKFVYGHAPAFEVWDPEAETPFTVSKDGLATPYARFSYDFQGIDFVEMREVFWDMLGARDANYFCGHEHMYGRGLAVDREGTWILQTIIGNGGAPLAAELPPDYSESAYVESYAGIDLPTQDGFPVLRLDSPRVASVAPARTNEFGYVVVDVLGSKIQATYKAEPAAGAGFQVIDSWVISGHGINVVVR